MTKFKVAIGAIEQDISWWKSLIKESQGTIAFEKKCIADLKEGKEIEGDGDYFYEGLKTKEEKIAQSEHVIKREENSIKDSERNIEELNEAIELLRTSPKKTK